MKHLKKFEQLNTSTTDVLRSPYKAPKYEPSEWQNDKGMCGFLVEHERSAERLILIGEYDFSNIEQLKRDIKSKSFDINLERGLPLRAAVRENNLQAFKVLISHGADLSMRRYIAAKLAAELGCVEILSYLIRSGRLPEDVIQQMKLYCETSTSIDDDIKQRCLQIIDGDI